MTTTKLPEEWCYNDITKLSDDDFWDEVRAHTDKIPAAADPPNCKLKCDSWDCNCRKRDRSRARKLEKVFLMIKVRTGGRHGHDI